MMQIEARTSYKLRNGWNAKVGRLKALGGDWFWVGAVEAPQGAWVFSRWRMRGVHEESADFDIIRQKEYYDESMPESIS